MTIGSSFVQTRPFSKDRLDQIAVRALDEFKPNGLQPEHIGLRTVDILFGYELNFSLFGGSATFQLTGAQIEQEHGGRHTHASRRGDGREPHIQMSHRVAYGV